MKDWLRHITLAPKVRRPVSVVGDSKTIGPISISVQVTGDPEWSRKICASIMDAFTRACAAEGLTVDVTGSFEHEGEPDPDVHYHEEHAHGGYARHTHLRSGSGHQGVPWGDKAK